MRDSQRLAAMHAQQMAEVTNQLGAMRMYQQREEDRLRNEWRVRDRQLWERIESVIKLEEDKVRTRVEAERREQERKQKEEELRRRLQQEQEERRRQEQEDTQRRQDEEKRRKEQEEQQRAEEERSKKAEGEQKKVMGLSSVDEDWRQARINLTVNIPLFFTSPTDFTPESSD